MSLRWCHNDHDGGSNRQPHSCLLNRLFRRQSNKTSKLRVTGLCVGNSPGPVNSPHKGPVTRKMFPFDDVIMFLNVLFLQAGYFCLGFAPVVDGILLPDEPIALRRRGEFQKVKLMTGLLKDDGSFFTVQCEDKNLNTLWQRQNGRHFSDISKPFSWMITFKFQMKFHWNMFIEKIENLKVIKIENIITLI